MHYDDSPAPARISVSSLLLLVIFASAAALIVAAIIWRPWFDDGAPVTTPPQTEIEAPAEGAEVAAEPGTEAAPPAEVAPGQ